MKSPGNHEHRRSPPLNRRPAAGSHGSIRGAYPRRRRSGVRVLFLATLAFPVVPPEQRGGPDAEPRTAVEARATAPDSFVIAFAGDILLHRALVRRARVGDYGYDFNPYFRNVKADITAADLGICHLETLIAGHPGRYSGYPRFQVPHQIADALRATGFDGCSLASNHTADGGAASLRATIAHFDRIGLRHTGAAVGVSSIEPALHELGGRTVAHLSYTYGSNASYTGLSLNLIEAGRIARDVEKVRSRDAHSFVIVSLHWGTEYRSGLSEYQEAVIESLKDLGIDVIVGHHAHVVQPMFRRGGLHVLAGLGNFLSGQHPRGCSCPVEVRDGVIVLVKVFEEGTGLAVSEIELIPTIVDLSDFTILRTETDDPTARVSRTVMEASARRTRAVMESGIRTGAAGSVCLADAGLEEGEADAKLLHLLCFGGSDGRTPNSAPSAGATSRIRRKSRTAIPLFGPVAVLRRASTPRLWRAACRRNDAACPPRSPHKQGIA